MRSDRIIFPLHTCFRATQSQDSKMSNRNFCSYYVGGILQKYEVLRE